MENEQLHAMASELYQKRQLIQAMEFLLAKALAHCQLRERPTENWEAQAVDVMRLLDQDRKERKKCMSL